MTPERKKDIPSIDLDNTLASATEFTGMLPAIAAHNDPEALSAAMDVPAPVIAAREDPAHSPLQYGSEHPYGERNRPRTTPDGRPATAPAPSRRD